MQTKIAFVNMPFSAAARPALGVSLLKAGLRARDIPSDIFYFNLRFAALSGVQDYSRVAYGLVEESLAGEWIFRDEVFGAATGQAAHYLEEIALGKFAQYFDVKVVLGLLKMRAAASGFIKECLQACDWSQYSIVGFTTTFQQNLASLALAKQIKSRYPQVLIAFGGGNCEGEMGIELHSRFPFIDVVCSGEGDLNFPEFVARAAAGEPPSEIHLDGIITRDGSSSSVPTNLVCPVENIDDLPVPSYDDYFAQLEKFGLANEVEAIIPIETSRGCWWGAKQHCTFCGLNGSTMKYRSKSAGRALAEIEELGKYGKEFHVADNIMDMKYLDSVIPALIDREFGYRFHYEVKVNLKKEHLRKLARAGVVNLQPGIESLSTSVLRLMRKGCTFLQNVQFLKWAKQYGITGVWNFLYGFPGEDADAYKAVEKWAPLLVHLRPPECCLKVRFDRFSPYFTAPESFGLRARRAHAAYAFIYPLEEMSLQRLAYYFEYDFDGKDQIDEYCRNAVSEISAWQQSEGSALLDARDSGEELLITDTRFGDLVTHRLTAAERELYLYCDESRSLSAICRRFPRLDATKLEEQLGHMMKLRLMVHEGQSYLSLAVIQDEEVPFREQEHATLSQLMVLT